MGGASYSIPGPAPLDCSSSGGGGSTTPPATGGGSTGSAALYGQCGGTGWTGPTACASGSCKVSSEYYSKFFSFLRGVVG